MFRHFVFLLGFLYSLAWAQFKEPNTGISYSIKEVELYSPNSLEYYTRLEMSYAEATIQTAKDWISADRIPYEIDIIFTKQPENLADWKISFPELLSKRIQSILALDTAFRDTSIRWTVYFQTKEKLTEPASKLFHGAVIKYLRVYPDSTMDIDVLIQKNMDFVKLIVSGKQPIKDPIIEKVFNRHPEWKESVVIIDWTGSMYPYGAELLRWHHDNIEKKRIKNLIFFNDGDDFLKQRAKGVQKPIGSAGGIYIANSLQKERVIELMEEVMTNGDGGEIPENNCEAIIQAQRQFPDAPYFIMIADNQSSVRDISLLKYLHKPVHIIVCGKSELGGVEPDYLSIAWHTGGSVCAIQEELTLSNKQFGQTEIQFLGKVYRLVGERFQRLTEEAEKK